MCLLDTFILSMYSSKDKLLTNMKSVIKGADIESFSVEKVQI